LGNPSRPDSAPETPVVRNDATGPSATLLAQSRAQRGAGNNAQARASIERALAIDPNNATLWVELGEIDLATGRMDEAATMARKALTLAPRDSTAAADASALLQRARH
jgi:Flp pilus assembly protein TadD